MWNTSDILTVIFHFTLFGLLVVKLHELAKQYLLPLLVKIQKGITQKWRGLEKEHAIVVVKKKNLATQFLQQEKQLALLSSKLEKWYEAMLIRQNREVELSKKLNKKTDLRYKEQQKRMAEKSIVERTTKNVISDIKKELLHKNTAAQKELFLHLALKKLSASVNAQAQED